MTNRFYREDTRDEMREPILIEKQQRISRTAMLV